MKNWLRQWLLRRIARRELEALERYRVAVDLVRRWNVMLAESYDTASWVRDVGEGHVSYAAIERFRHDLMRAADRRSAMDCKQAVSCE